MELTIVQIALIGLSGLPFGMVLWHYITKPEREHIDRFWINRERQLLKELKGYWSPEITVCSSEQFQRLLKDSLELDRIKGRADSLLESYVEEAK